jgi:two-component system OmpR family sensor kinase
MKRFRSIRWRLQFWSGMLLALVLGGFIMMSGRLERTSQYQRVDQELEEHISIIAGAIRTPGQSQPNRPPRDPDRQDKPPRDRPPQDKPPQDKPPQDRPVSENAPLPPLEKRLSARDLSLFDGPPGKAFYYIVWPHDDREIARSVAAPTDAPRPERGTQVRDSRMRGSLRERFHFLPTGECILVGRAIGSELAGVHRFTWLLAALGAVVLTLGLAGGWWISTRALRPIGDISRAAARISTGDLGQRIQTDDTSSELGDLARVLNDTFARLQAGFARQAQFTADASHELRTPVTVVLTQTQAALAHDRPAAEYRESLAACQRSAQRMRQLIESLLTLARLDSGEAVSRKPCSMDQVAVEVVELLRPLAQENQVVLELESQPTLSDGNAEQLGQIITNLVTNAIVYNRPGGTVQVKVAAEPGAAVLIISDTGQGIAPEDLPHIFERFYRADKSRSGASGRTGLGLAIAKAIVEAHGGTINVNTEWGAGSTFTVRLPIGKNPQSRSF